MSRLRLDFFRQSAWMVMATTLGSVFFIAVHKVAKDMPEYGLFCALLQVLTLMSIPATALQMTLVKKSVAAAEGLRAELAGALRSLAAAAVGLWSVAALLAFIFQHQLMANYGITNPAALWITLGVGLASLISPLLLGTLQGQQNFLWMGGISVTNAMVRFVAVALIVGKFGGQAAGAMLGALIGMLMVIALAGWQVREWWRGPAAPFAWRAWVKQVAPITVGLGSVLIMVSTDMLVVQRYFPKDETKFYGAAGTIARALYFFTAPMALVLFPKIVRSAMRAEKSTVLAQAVGATAALGTLAALACTLVPELPLRILYDPSYLKVAPLVPQFAWCMLPVTVSAVLINDLLARERTGVIYCLAAIAAGYWLTLRLRHESFEQVIHTLGLFGSLMLACSLAFAWRDRKKSASASRSQPVREAQREF